MRRDTLREFRLVEAPGDDRIMVNLAYLVSVAPSATGKDRTVIRVTTGRGFEEYTVRGTYDETRAVIYPAADDAA